MTLSAQEAEVFIQVNQAICAGCGLCVEACPTGALQLVAQRAVVDPARCNACQACIEACPNGAITALAVPSPRVSLSRLPAGTPGDSPIPAGRDMIISPSPARSLEAISPARRGLATSVGAALAFLGREIAPRLIDTLFAALDRRLAPPAAARLSTPSAAPGGFAARGRRQRRQTRLRSGNNRNINPMERR